MIKFTSVLTARVHEKEYVKDDGAAGDIQNRPRDTQIQGFHEVLL